MNGEKDPVRSRTGEGEVVLRTGGCVGKPSDLAGDAGAVRNPEPVRESALAWNDEDWDCTALVKLCVPSSVDELEEVSTDEMSSWTSALGEVSPLQRRGVGDRGGGEVMIGD
jgi:hypothetical protein